MAHVFFDSLFNAPKFLYHESKDTATIRAEMKKAHLSDWVKFAEDEYDHLAQEEEEEEQEEHVRLSGKSDWVAFDDDDD